MFENIVSLLRVARQPRKTLTDFITREIQKQLLQMKNGVDEKKNGVDEKIVSPNEIVSSVNPISRVSGYWGYAESTASLNETDKLAAFLNFQYSEKLNVSLSVASSFKGGDYVEFGSHDLYTLRNMLAAFDVGGLDKRYPETQFYAFDIFGKFSSDDLKTQPKYNRHQGYFEDFTHSGDLLEHYQNTIKEFDVFKDRTHLIQGFFEETLPKTQLTNKIGFAFLDCNIVPSYEYVLDWLFDKIQLETHIYFDEYFDMHQGVYHAIERFRWKLENERGLELVFVRPVASVGGLFRVYEKTMF